MGYNKHWTPYVSDKARLDFACQYLSERFNEHHKCKVTNVAAGFVDTQAVAMFKPFIKEYCFMQPEDVANICAFLAADQSSYITGQVINVDGGMVT